MYNRNDPRFRRTLNQISQNLESANESAQVGLFSFSEHYIKPCLGAIGTAIEPCTTACFPTHRDRLRRQHQQGRGHTRGALEYSFDFYDDWEDDENDALLALEDDEFDRVVPGGYGTQAEPQQPHGHRANMNYGARDEARPARARRKSNVLPYDVGPDPTVIPNQSYFGFLNKLPFKIGRGGLRYKPSAADLQVRPKGAEALSDEEEPLLEEENEAGEPNELPKKTGRTRSGTTNSAHTTESLSSRGDIFPSDDEDDAVPFDDEFTIALERRTTNSGADDSSSTKGQEQKPIDNLRPSSNTPSSKSSRRARNKRKKKRLSTSSTPTSNSSDPEMGEVTTLSALKQEDQRALSEEEDEIAKNREKAQRLAVERGLVVPEQSDADVLLESKVEERPSQDATLPATREQDYSIADRTIVVADGPITMEDNEAPKPSQTSGSE